MKNIKRLIFIIAFAVLLGTATVLADAPEITGTSVRVEAPIGIRVTAEIATPFEESAVQEYGFIVSRKVFLSGNGLSNTELVLGCDIYYDKGISYGYDDGEFVDRFFDRNDDKTVFAAYLHGIPAYYYPEVFVVRPYVKMTDSSSVYGEPVEVSLYGEAKKVKADSELYELLEDSQKAVIDGVIIAVEGEPYTIDRNDFCIVVSSNVRKNLNPTYSVYYDLFNPYTGEILRDVSGRKKSRNYSEIEGMLLEPGSIVPMYDGIVQDTTDGYIADVLTSDCLTLIGGIDTSSMTMTRSLYDASLTCRECVKQSVAGNIIGNCKVSAETPVTVVNTMDMTLNTADIQSVIDSDKSLLCFFEGAGGISYADYIKAYVSVSPDGVCEYIIAVVHPYEGNASDITCLKHTYFDVDFYVDGSLYDSSSVIYNGIPNIPKVPEKLGYTFVGWENADGEIVNPETVAVTKNTEYKAVFEINTYSVVFCVDGEEYSRSIVSYGNYPELPKAPEKPGYDFVGWVTEDGESVNPEGVAVTKDTEYYAVFEREIVYYDVTFYFNGEVVETLSVLSGETASEPEFEPECGDYKRFAGWSLTENGGLADVVDVSETAIYGDTDFYGVVETNPNSPEFLEKIQRGYKQLKKLKTSKPLEKQALATIKECVGYIVDDALAFNFIDKNYAYNHYESMVGTVKNIVKVQMTYEERSAFVTFLTDPDKIDADVQDFIIDYFDINTNLS